MLFCTGGNTGEGSFELFRVPGCGGFNGSGERLGEEEDNEDPGYAAKDNEEPLGGTPTKTLS